jgi:hypothetical protein
LVPRAVPTKERKADTSAIRADRRQHSVRYLAGLSSHEGNVSGTPDCLCGCLRCCGVRSADVVVYTVVVNVLIDRMEPGSYFCLFCLVGSLFLLERLVCSNMSSISTEDIPQEVWHPSWQLKCIFAVVGLLNFVAALDATSISVSLPVFTSRS